MDSKPPTKTPPADRCFRDEAGDARIETPPADRLLCAYLEGDLQENPEACRRILRAVERTVQGEISRWQETGNAHTVILTPEEVILESELDEDAPSWRGGLTRFRAGVETWLDFVRRGQEG